MERLTHMNGDGYWVVDSDECYDDQSEQYCGPAIDRLAAYEDTDLEPCEIKATDRILGDISWERLWEIMEAEREGRLAVLPCKPGTMVQYKENPADKSKVDAITLYADGRMTFSFHDYGVKQTFVDDWSEDEAEKYVPCRET